MSPITDNQLDAKEQLKAEAAENIRRFVAQHQDETASARRWNMLLHDAPLSGDEN